MAAGVVGMLEVVLALVVGTATGAVVVGAGVVAQVTSGSCVLSLSLPRFLDLPFCLYPFPYPWKKGLPPPRTKDAGMTST